MQENRRPHRANVFEKTANEKREQTEKEKDKFQSELFDLFDKGVTPKNISMQRVAEILGVEGFYAVPDVNPGIKPQKIDKNSGEYKLTSEAVLKMRNKLRVLYPLGTWEEVTKSLFEKWQTSKLTMTEISAIREQRAIADRSEKLRALSALMHQHLNEIIGGSYTAQNLFEDSGKFDTLKKLQSFLKNNFREASLKNIAKNIINNEKALAPAVPEQGSQEIIANVKKIVSPMFEADMRREQIKTNLEALIKTRKLPPEAAVFNAFGTNTWAEIIYKLQTEWKKEQ